MDQLAGGVEKRDARFIGPKALRIIGGRMKRKSVIYNGDRQTRPMKDNVRENLFNILGKSVEGAVAWDLFAGTGILALESLSRGAQHAIAIDAARGAAQSIRNAAESLGLGAQVEVLQGDTFRLAKNRLELTGSEHRIVFCCPPYRLWHEMTQELHQLVTHSLQEAAPGSVIVCEMDGKTDPAILPDHVEWDVRTYGNVRLAFAEPPAETADGGEPAT